MILNLPNSHDFEKVSKECFIQALNLLFKVTKNLHLLFCNYLYLNKDFKNFQNLHTH